MPDPRHCPACGALNQCGLADPRSATQGCWCFSVRIEPAIIQALPAELRDQACLCPRCAQVDAQLKALSPPPIR
ncbi:cysteine-rich CWC family protein [Pseudomonas sp. RIT623]|uniref:cysteine-rich CWC family protein n=1 Tax=Pseudomonas sp. RIT623 TaxID=2559075 RepID=UPI00106FB600|nr:cysteine-rich CWC family protein [Pseudomonas sp. RIT623]TFF41138.1 helicase [Pseudomonas sp. RIT623]